jgi:hypothetical protein
VNVGIQGEEPVEHFAKQADVAFAGKAIAIEGHLDVYAP